MKLFISWSGAKSLAVAEILREELPCLINELEIFLSSEDIEKGSAWFQGIASELDKANFGIICLTADNLQKPWILFEAGALAGKFSQKKVAPLLIELDPAQVAPPLSHMQLTKFVELDFFRLLCSINKYAGKPVDEAILGRSFKRSWKEIVSKVKERLSALPKPLAKQVVNRTPEEKMDELLSITRSIAANLPAPQPVPQSLGLGGALANFNPPNNPAPIIGLLGKYYEEATKKTPLSSILDSLSDKDMGSPKGLGGPL